MSWSRKFPKPIVIKDGRTMETLREASEIILALPERTQQRPHWQYAGELLIEAADHGLDLTDAWAQLRRALIVSRGCSRPSEVACPAKAPSPYPT
jgi:hypothetical protein